MHLPKGVVKYLIQPRAQRMGLTGLRAESARTVTGIRALTVHNMYFVKYIFPRNQTSSDLNNLNLKI